MNRIGQAAIEFALITTAMLLVFAGVIIVAEQQYLEIVNTRVDQAVWDLLLSIEEELLIAHEAGMGYERQVFFPVTLGGEPYDFSILLNTSSGARDAIILDAYDEEYLRFPQIDISGTLEPGWTLFLGGDTVLIAPILEAGDLCELNETCHAGQTLCVPDETARMLNQSYGDTLGPC